MRVLWGRLAARRLLVGTGRGVVAYTSWPMSAPRIITECVHPDWIADSVSSIPLIVGGNTGPLPGSIPAPRSAWGQGRQSRGAVKGSALPQKADQPLLQSIISSVPDSDVAGPKILAYSRVRSVAAVRSLRRAVWSTLGLAGEQAWICAIVTTFMIFGVWPSGECPVRSSIISTAPRTRRQHTGTTRKPSKAATLYPASCAGLGALIFQSPPWARSSRCRSIALHCLAAPVPPSG